MADAWRGNPPWAKAYSFIVERSRLGQLLWKAGIGSDLSRLYEAAAELGELPDGATVLDLPCGGGVALRGLRAGQDVRYVAADISPSMLGRTRQEAARLGVDIETVEADVGALPFGDASFDMVVTFTSLHCFPDPQNAVSELTRVLRPGGTLSGSALLNDNGPRASLLMAIGRPAGLTGPGVVSGDLRRWLSEVGLGGVRLERSGGITYFRAVKAP